MSDEEEFYEEDFEEIKPPNSPTIQNVVATVTLNVNLELTKIVAKLRNSEYQPNRFSAMITRIRDPKVTALVFRSGKVVVTGAKSISESKRAAAKLCILIQNAGEPNAKFDLNQYKIHNIVGSVGCNFGINMQDLEEALSGLQPPPRYEPELFPGMIISLTDDKLTLLVFASGKVVFTGAKVERQIQEAYESLYPHLARCQKHSENNN